MPVRTVEVAFLGSTAQLEAALERAGLVADKSGSTIGDAFTKGTSRAGGAISKLASEASSLGVPFAGSLTVIGKHLDEATSKTARLHTAVAELGKVTLIGGLAGGAVAAAEAAKLGMAYENAGAQIKASTGQSSAAIKQVDDAFASTAGHFEVSGQKMEAAYAGVSGQLKATEGHALGSGEALKFQANATNLSTGAGEELDSTTQALAATMQTFHLQVGQSSAAGDELFNVSKALDAPISTVSTSIDKLHGRLNQLAPSLKDTGTLMLDMGEHGITGSRGAMLANTALQTLIGGSKNTSAVLKALGVDVYDQNGKFIGLQNVIAQLQPKLAGLEEHQQNFALKTLFGAGASQVLGRIIQQGVPGYDKASDAATKLGTAHAAAEAKAHTFGGELKTLEATLETTGGKIGLDIIPDLQKMTTGLEDGIGWMQKHKAVAEALGLTISGVLGTAVLVFAEQKAVAFGKGVGSMIGDMGKLVKWIGSGTDQMVGMFSAQGAAAEESAQTVSAASAQAGGAVEVGAAKMQASNATADASFAELGPAAVSGTAAVDTAVAGEATAVTAADGTIEAENVAAGASFMAMLGPIGAVVAAVAAAEPVINKLTGGGLGETAAEGQRAGAGLTGSHAGSVTSQALTQLEQSGLSPIAASGAVGNFAQESSDDPSMDTKEGRGLASWTGSREAALEAYAKSMGVSPNNEGTQIEFLVKELRSRGELGKLNAAKTPQEAADIFEKYFEQAAPKTANMSHREKAAEEAYNSTTHTGHNKAGGLVEEGVVHAKYKTPQDKSAAQAEKAIKEAEKHANNPALQALMEEASGAKKKKTAAALGVPVGVATMLKTAQELLGTKYTSGGGHGSSADDPVEMLKKIGVDCSGFVSKVLSSGGISSVTGLTTSGLPGAAGISPGAGKYVTVYDRPQGSQAHEIIDILGKYFESGGSPKYNPKGGVALLTSAQAKGELSGGGFEAFHPTALNKAVKGGVEASALTKGLAPQEAESAAFAQFVKKREAEIKSTGTKELSKLSSAASSGNISQIQGVLGARTSGGAAASGPAKEYDQLLASVKALGDKSLVTQLAAAHKSAMVTEVAEVKAVAKESAAQLLQNQATEEKDRTTIAADTAAKQLQTTKDAATQQTDALTAAATQIDDMTSVVRSQMEAAATALTDQLQTSSDSTSGEVLGIKDKSQIEVDTLSERGLYGLNLVAQQEQVQLDQMKAGYDIQISQAQIALDQAKTQEDQLVAQDKTNVALLQAHEDATIAQAQAHADAIQISEDMSLATAQAQVDSAQLAGDVSVDSAKLAEIFAAGGTKAQQNQAKNYLAEAEGKSAKADAEASAHLAQVEGVANAAIQSATSALQATQGEAQIAIAQANQAVATAEANAQKITGLAERELQGIKSRAEVEEAKQEAIIDKTKAEASTQYAGTGTTINIEGVNPTDAQEIASKVNWAMLTRVPATR